jgi:hypothetical protein
VNRHVTLGGGIGALPGTRTTEGTFPFWLTLDNRMIADEFFRPSYTMGIWASGRVVDRVEYMAMLGNNLSQFGVDAGQLDDELSTFSAVVQWFPTTGEFGKRGGYGDFDRHNVVATRLGTHFTISDEDRQGQPNTEGFENVQIRLSDGSVIFQPGLFGSGILVDGATYHMFSLDGGAKWRGLALEGEYYWRLVNGFQGPGTGVLDDLEDNGFQLLGSAVVMPEVQLYAGGSKVFGQYGDPWDARFGLNWFPWGNTVLRWNFEYLYIDRSPVGALSLPYVVGGTGSVFQANLQVDF